MNIWEIKNPVIVNSVNAVPSISKLPNSQFSFAREQGFEP